MRYLEKALYASYPPAYLYKGWLYEQHLKPELAEKLYDKAKVNESWFQQNANENDATIQFSVGLFNDLILGDFEKSRPHYYDAARLKSPEALVRTSEYCSIILNNPEEAARRMQAAADGGHRDAQFEIASFYLEGYGVIKNLAEARKYFEKAADLGDRDAQQELDKLAAYAQEIRKEQEEIKGAKDFRVAQIFYRHEKKEYALPYLVTAAEAKYPPASLRLYEIYQKNGNEALANQYYLQASQCLPWLTQQADKSAGWFTKEEKYNHARFLFLLGVYHEWITKDMNKAGPFYESAAELFDVDALSRLGHHFYSEYRKQKGSLTRTPAKAKEDKEKAFDCLELAGNNMDVGSLRLLAEHFKTKGADKSEKKAKKYFDRVAIFHTKPQSPKKPSPLKNPEDHKNERIKNTMSG